MSELDVAGYLRPGDARGEKYLARKVEDHRALTVAMMFALGPVAASLWIWDYVVDPIGAQHTVGLRLACFLVGILPALVFWRVRNRFVLQATVGIAMLAAIAIFSAIVTMLKTGVIYGVGGYMFFALAVILVTQGFSARFGIGLAFVCGAFPQLLAVAGLIPGFQQAAYSVLIWPEVAMVGAAILALSHNYATFYDTREQLERVSAIDPLTGAANRRLFMPLLEKEIARSRRFGHPLSLLMLDIDAFKDINDTFGHPAGDRVLQQMAHTCRRTIRESDTLARLGGDEFAILLPETDAAGACELAESLRAAIESAPAEQPDGIPVRHTVSIGSVQARETDVHEATLIARADAALYEAKQGGRNCVRGEFALQDALPSLEAAL